MCQLSIIIPMYNGKQYILNTVSEIAKLSCSHEIIIVDDGSKDDSYKHCQQSFCHRSNIKLHKKANGGIADTRNFGLNYAEGDFVLFVDQDDKINAPVIDRAVEIITHSDVDAVYWSTLFEFENGNTKPCDSIYGDCTIDKAVIIDKIIPNMLSNEANEFTSYPGHLWSAIYRRALIEENGIRFKKFIDYEDDLVFVFDYLLRASKIGLMKDVGYFWKSNLKSYSHTGKYIQDYIKKAEGLYSYFEVEYEGTTGKKLARDVTNHFRQYTIIGAIKNTCISSFRVSGDVDIIKKKRNEDRYKAAFSSSAWHLNGKRENLTYYLAKYKAIGLAIFMGKLYYRLRSGRLQP